MTNMESTAPWDQSTLDELDDVPGILDWLREQLAKDADVALRREMQDTTTVTLAAISTLNGKLQLANARISELQQENCELRSKDGNDELAAPPERDDYSCYKIPLQATASREEVAKELVSIRNDLDALVKAAAAMSSSIANARGWILDTREIVLEMRREMFDTSDEPEQFPSNPPAEPGCVPEDRDVRVSDVRAAHNAKANAKFLADRETARVGEVPIDSYL